RRRPPTGRAGRIVRQDTSMTSPATRAADSVLDRVRTLAHNLWWTWNPDAQRLFASMDPPLWEASGHNPIKTLKLLAPERCEALARDVRFEENLTRCERELDRYLKTKTWFDRTRRRGKVQIAYFC